MRALILILLSAFLPNISMAEDSCPAGERRLGNGEPCIPAQLFTYLYCLSKVGNGVVEVTTKTDNSGSKTLEFNVAGSGSGVIFKGAGNAGAKMSEASRAAEELSKKIDPTLASRCQDMSPAAPLTGPNVVAPEKQKSYTGRMAQLEPGISYNQGDLYDRPADSPEACSALCYNDDRCIAVTFIESQQRCWVKNAIGPIGRSSDMISARKLAQ